MIHKLTEEKACAVQQSQKLRQELVSDLLVLLFYKENNTYIYLYIYIYIWLLYSGDAEERIKQEAVWWWSFLGVDAVGWFARLCDWIHLERPDMIN